MFGGNNERYVYKDFKTTEGFMKSNSGTTAELYKQIVDFANKNKYKIVKIGKIEDAHMSKLAVSVIFENEK